MTSLRILWLAASIDVSDRIRAVNIFGAECFKKAVDRLNFPDYAGPGAITSANKPQKARKFNNSTDISRVGPGGDPLWQYY